MTEITQRIVWTICPAGLSEDGRRFRINLHVSPRLVLPAGIDPADLSHFPAWRHWPQIIADAEFTVLGLPGGGRPGHLTRLTPGVLEADSAFWDAMFRPATPVIPHAFDDYRGKDVLTAPIAALADAIEQEYASLAIASPGPDLPAVGKLGAMKLFAPKEPTRSLVDLLALLKNTGTERIRDIGTMLDLLEVYHRPLAEPQIRSALKRTLPDGRPDPRDPHEDTQYNTVDRVEMPRPEDLRDIIDFHRIVSSIGQHPALMERAWLSIPIEIERDGVPDGNYSLSVNVRWHHGDVTTLDDVCCVTHTKVADQTFVALPSSALVTDGWMRADDPSLKLVQLDVDGAGLTIKNFSRQLPNIKEERFDDDHAADQAPAQTGAPRLRTGGVQFAHDRRDVAIRGLFDTAGKHDDKIDTGNPVELFAEDLIKGWRIDVRDVRRGEWCSLMRFDGTYTLTSGTPAIPPALDQEAIARLAATGTASDKPDVPDPTVPQYHNILKASEALFSWAGWSLAAPPLGQAVMPDDTESVGDAPNTVPPGLPLSIELVARPKSLPTLRFGHGYQVRLRSADLTGYGPPPTPNDVNLAGIVSSTVNFGRYEPVETPVLTLIDKPGNPLPSDGESMPRAALRTLDDADANTSKVIRNVSPARVGHRFAEMHGVIDDADGRPRADLYAMLVGRDKAYPELTVTTQAWVETAPAGDAPSVETKYSIAPEHSAVPYFPDPLAAGCAIRVTGLPGVNEQKVYFIPFYGDTWKPAAKPELPDQQGFTLLAQEDGTLGWDPGARQFTVPLDRGERARLYISALVPNAGIELLKLKELVIASGGNAAWKKLEPAVKAGQHWMFTPARRVELVHALQRPLITPSLSAVQVFRAVGDLGADITHRTPLHAKSTARIDMDGEWIEITDDPNEPKPIISLVHAHGFDFKPYRSQTPSNDLTFTGKHVFADTRARHIAYKATATTRFREYMPAAIRSDAGLLTKVSEPNDMWVSSSACPPAPAIRYIVPTFGWVRSGQGSADQHSWRRGGGVRVYLDRPWFVSGSNEMLAVCLPTAEVGDPQTNAAKNYVTQWGADPTWAGTKVGTIAPVPSDFPMRIAKGPLPYAIPLDPTDIDPVRDGIALGDVKTGPYVPHGAPDSVQVDVVPHPVGYDAERKLWYCDIVVRPGDVYFPFIRLGLARFQPASIKGQELSAAVLADFAQLTADRLVVVTPGSNDPRMRIVTVYGNTPTDTQTLPSAGDVRFELQRLKKGDNPDLDWQPTREGPPSILPPNSGPHERTPRKIRRRRLTKVDRNRLIDANQLIEAGRFREVLADTTLFDLFRPPQIGRTLFITLPEREEGERLRLLITEVETYDTGPEMVPVGEPQKRIVYAETIEL